MDTNRLDGVLRALGTQTSVSGNKVRCSCLLAPWTHSGGRDEKPSMVVFPQSRSGGGPVYKCLGCHEKGMLRDLICLIWHKTGQNLCRLIEVLDGEVEQIPAGFDAVAHRRQATVRQASYSELKKKRVKEASGREGPWFDKHAIEKAKKVPEIPWEEYEPYVGSVPPYALERGLTIDTCREWELGHDRSTKRLLMPMRDRDGRLVAISGRLYVDGCPWCGHKIFVRPEGAGKSKDRCGNCGSKKEPKYRHSLGFKRNLHLYGEHREDGGELVYVVEGHLDVLALWQGGYRSVVALLGSEPGEAQVEKLVAWWKRIIIVPDADAGGDYMAGKLKHMVAGRVPVTICRPPETLDPGKLTIPQQRDLLGAPQALAA